MYLRDILAEINLKMPSGLSESEWIRYLNSAIRRYGRHLGFDNCFRFNTVCGQRYYPLLSYMQGDGIKGVTASGRELMPVRYGEEMKECTYAIDPTGYLMLSYVPEKAEPVLILCSSPKPFETKEEIAQRSDKTEAEQKVIYDFQSCGIYDEYIDAVIYGALSGYCEASEDITAAANYKAQCEEIVRRAMQSRYSKRGKYPVSKCVNIRTRLKRQK